MFTTKLPFTSQSHLSSRSTHLWRISQFLIWLAGGVIIFNLLVFPTVGIHLFWNILIPIAPALFVVSVGLWRNVCPMASTSLFPRHLGYSKRKKITPKQSGRLNLIAVIALFLIVPLRHAIFDTNGTATAILIISMALIGIIAGLFYEWKSAWCSGLCPIHPVEKLYAVYNRFSIKNAHCDSCVRCVIPCPDTTPGITPLSLKKINYHYFSGIIMVGAFPGFIWGWFQVPDYDGIVSIEQLISIYQPPVVGLLVTTALFLTLKSFITQQKFLIKLFSAAAVSCYYWFRLPALIGFGVHPGDGMLVDLTMYMPEWLTPIIVLSSTIFFFWWIVFSKPATTSWQVRPAYANTNSRS